VAQGIVASLDPKVSEFLFQMEEKHFWHIGRKELILDTIRDIPGSASGKILEIGCGNGSVLSFLKRNGLDVTGGDISPECLLLCRQRDGNIPLMQLDVLDMTFVSVFDIVGLFDVLEHIGDDEKAIQGVSIALKPGGRVVITVPAHKFLWRRADEIAKHKRRYSRTEIRSKLERNGFKIEKQTFFMSVFLPLFLVLAVVSKVHKQRSIKSIIEFRTIPVVNTVCLWLLRQENKLVRRTGLPIGASMLIVARKEYACTQS
jgi:SAM-dependent methyltransferase